LSPGFLFDTENPDAVYTTGTEFHLDWLVGQYFSEHFGVGVNGCYYRQITADDGQVAGPIDVSNFRGMGVGIGPAAVVSIPLGSWTTLSIIGKALFDIESEDALGRPKVVLKSRPRRPRIIYDAPSG
jgi:hypothetical protein